MSPEDVERIRRDRYKHGECPWCLRSKGSCGSSHWRSVRGKHPHAKPKATK